MQEDYENTKNSVILKDIEFLVNLLHSSSAMVPSPLLLSVSLCLSLPLSHSASVYLSSPISLILLVK